MRLTKIIISAAIVVFIFAGISFIDLSRPYYDYRWTQITADGGFTPRDGAHLKYFPWTDSFYLLCGWYGDSTPNLLRQHNRSKDLITWDSLALVPFNARHSYGCVMTDTSMFIIGGDYNSDIIEYDGSTFVTRESNVASLANRRAFLCGSANGKIYWAGGFKDSIGAAPGYIVTTHRRVDIWSWDGDTIIQELDSMPFSAAGTTYGMPFWKDEFWIYRGSVVDTILNAGDPVPSNRTPVFEYYPEMWSWNPTTGKWTNRGATPYGAAYSSVFIFNNNIWLSGGYITNTTNISYTYHSSLWGTDGTIIWKNLSSITTWSGRHAQTMLPLGDTVVYLTGGMQNANPNMKNDVWKMENQ